MTIDRAMVADRLAVVRERIRAAGGIDVRVVAVTKTFGFDAVAAAVAAGVDGIGENYAQEVVAKFTGRAPSTELHFIGRLQTNKVRVLAPLVAVFETIDRSSLAAEVARRAPGARVLVQVDAAGDDAKGGCPLPGVGDLVHVCRSLGLVVEGLMIVGPTEGGPAAARPGFRVVRSLVDELRLAVCSMGMTGDLEVAVEEGATQVRVGSALFGPRPPHR